MNQWRLELESLKFRNNEVFDELSAKLKVKDEMIKKLEDGQVVDVNLYEDKNVNNSQVNNRFSFKNLEFYCNHTYSINSKIIYKQLR